MDPRQWTCSQVIQWLSSFNKNKQVLDVFTRKPYCKFIDLFKHIQYVHNGQLDFKVRCELAPLCGRIYSTFAAYKGHIYRQHVDLLNEDLYRKEVQIITDTHDDKTLLATNYATQSDFNMQIYDGENEEDESEEEIEDEDTICWPLLKETIARSVEDLNALQIDGIFIPTLQTHLNFAFTVVTGDHLASNDIGGFQKIFNTGEFCRHCHINYNQKLVPWNEITHRRRIQDQHNNFVQQVTNLNNNVTLHDVVGTSPLVNLIGFHAVTSLPNDPMHDYNEGVCDQLLMAMLKEASTKRLLTYGEDIDGETLFNLLQSMMYEIIKPMKDRVTTQSRIIFSRNNQGEDPVLDSATTSDVIHEEVILSSKEDENKENDVDAEEPTLPSLYIIPDLPLRIQQIIDKGEIGEFCSHTNARRLLLDTIFNGVTTKYSLLYPTRDQYRLMGKSILKKLNTSKDNKALNDWIESLKTKFKRECRPLQQISVQVQKMKAKYGNSAGRPIKRSENVIAPRRISPVQFWNTIDIHDDPEDLNKNIQVMKNELIDRNVDSDLVRSSWKKTLVQRRNFIRNHTTKEVLDEYPGYCYASLIFDEIRYVCNVVIEENLKSMLPKLLDSILDNSHFVNDLPAVRLIQLLSKYFTDSWQQIISNKEPSSPRPTIQITTDQFIIFLDYEVISETSSIDQPICIIISLYVMFELQFGIHNRIIQLLYGILLKQSGALTKPLPTLENLTQIEDNQTDVLSDSEEQEEYVKSTTGNSQNQTTATYIGDKDLINEYSSESSGSSSSLSPIGPPLVIHISPTKEKQRQIASSSSSNDNILYEANIKQQVSATSTGRSSTITNKKTCQAKKRPASFEEPIALHVKRTRVKRQIN
ncbi:unnamed protein product [Adineta steineri]|uniref:C2H2-type domain-containing protein n=1 Tax=Adineta steineri TaxID=433720 RepID=A0A819C7N3_9BILA|nr:unnamed protein product [Adineta steineri]